MLGQLHAAQTTAELFDRLRAHVRCRVSDALFCMHDIITLFPSPVHFSRSELIAGLHAVYNARTIDRAVEQLEAHGIVTCVEGPRGGPKGGAIYRCECWEQWHRFDGNKLDERHSRYHLALHNAASHRSIVK